MDPMQLVDAAFLNGAGVVSVVLLVGFLIWRGYLIPRPTHREVVSLHETRANEAGNRADRWEAVALKALHASEALAEPVAVTAKVLTKLPNPAQEGLGT